MRDDEDGSVVDGQTGLPNREGWEAVLEAEEQRSRRHGGTHGLVLIRLEPVGTDGAPAEEAAGAVARVLRETDLLARIDDRTFGILALYCERLETVVGRLRVSLEGAGVQLAALIDARSAGTDLLATWAAMVNGSEPATPTARHIAFVASSPLSLN
jgi:GGDEF domain-containing protein